MNGTYLGFRHFKRFLKYNPFDAFSQRGSGKGTIVGIIICEGCKIMNVSGCIKLNIKIKCFNRNK